MGQGNLSSYFCLKSGTNNTFQVGCKDAAVLNFQAYLRADKSVCQRNESTEGRKKIQLFQFSDDALDINYKCAKCECDDAPVPQADECSNKGTLICGGCQCEPGFKGNLGTSIS